MNIEVKCYKVVEGQVMIPIVIGADRYDLTKHEAEMLEAHLGNELMEISLLKEGRNGI